MMTRWLLAGVVAIVLCGCALPAQVAPGPPSGQSLVQPHILKIPVNGAGLFGGDIAMVVHLYRPPGAGPFPVVVFSHGRSPNPSERQHLKAPVSVGHGNFWIRKGFALIAPVRPGYGDTGGVDRENSGIHWYQGQCIGTPDFASVVHAAGEAVFATLEWVRAQPWARQDKILLVGQSVGGVTTVGVGAKNPPGVIGYINFVGGHGGSPQESPGRSCHPERLTAVFKAFGKTTQVPSLWLYAENDLFWGSEAPRAWHRAFQAGGSPTHFVMTSPVPDTSDGHRLLAVGGQLWVPHVNAFVKELGF